jgi:hypothetical protein
MSAPATMDQIHYEATGEHMSPIPGDACPRPVEYYIVKTQERQARVQRYKVYYDRMRKAGETVLSHPSYPHGDDGVPPHTSVQLQQDVIGCPIYLFYMGVKVAELWPDGRERQPPTPVCSAPTSPALRFTLPSWAMRSRVSSPVPLSPIVGVTADEIEAAAAAAVPASRLRTGFTVLLKKMPLDALYAELTEWTEEQARAAEHVQAIETEIARRTGS